MSEHIPHSTPATPPTPDDQYLWNGSGQPDASTTRIESALGSFRYTGEPKLPARATPLRTSRPLAIAAVLLLAGITIYMVNRPSPTPGPTPVPAPTPAVTWTIASHGDVTIGEPRPVKSTITMRDVTVRDGGRVTLTAGKSSTVQVEGAAKLEVADCPDQYPWLTLAQGQVFAQVATTDNPIIIGVHNNALTLQPGAAASITTTPDATQLACKTGEAHINWPRQPTRVLGPATCQIDSSRGPDLPMPVFASKEACGAIEKLDDMLPTMMKNPKGAETYLIAYLDQSKPSDAPVLWNLLYRVPMDFRKPVRDTLYKHIKAPKLDPDLILKLDPGAMDAWWTASVEAAKQP